MVLTNTSNLFSNPACRPFFLKKMAEPRRKVEKNYSKVPNEPILRGLQTGCWQNFVWQKRDFWAENRVFRPKKYSLFDFNHVLATTKQSCANKREPFSEINLQILGVFLEEMNRFFGQKTLFGKT